MEKPDGAALERVLYWTALPSVEVLSAPGWVAVLRRLRTSTPIPLISGTRVPTFPRCVVRETGSTPGTRLSMGDVGVFEQVWNDALFVVGMTPSGGHAP